MTASAAILCLAINVIVKLKPEYVTKGISYVMTL